VTWQKKRLNSRQMFRNIRMRPLILAIRVATLATKLALNFAITTYLGLEALGLFGVLSAVTVVCPLVFGLGLQNSVARDLVSASAEKSSSLVISYWKLTATIYLSVTIPSLMIAYMVRFRWDLVLCMILISWLEHINQDIYVFLITRGRPIFANIQLFLRSASWAILYMLLAAFNLNISFDGLLSLWLSGLIISIAIFMFSDGIGWITWPKIWRAELPGRKYVFAARFLYLSDIAFAIEQYFDRAAISMFLGLEAAGIYVFYWQLTNAVYNLISASVIQVETPKLIHLLASNGRGVRTKYTGVHWDLIVWSLLLFSTLLLVTHYLAPITGRDEISTYYLLGVTLSVLAYARIYSTWQMTLLFASRGDTAFALSSLMIVAGTVLCVTSAGFFTTNIYVFVLANLVPQIIVILLRSSIVSSITRDADPS
jgi:hypothetical protein